MLTTLGPRATGSLGDVWKTLSQHVALRHRVDRRRGIDEVNPELLVRLGRVVDQGLGAAEEAGTRVEDGQVQGESTIYPDIAVDGCASRDRSCLSLPRACPGA